MCIQNCSYTQVLEKGSVSLQWKARTIQALLHNSEIDHRQKVIACFSMPRITHS